MSKILIIDDDKTICFFLNTILSKEGYETDSAFTGLSALSRLDNNTFDLVFCDLNLPDMQGRDILKKIVSDYPNIPVIIVTANNEIKTAVSLVKAGANNYITKPFTRDDVVTAARAALVKGQHVDGTSQTSVGSAKKNYNPEDSFYADSLYIDKNTGNVQQLNDLVKLIAGTDYSVILTGTNNTLKKDVALSIHSLSNRGKRPFIDADCKSFTKDNTRENLFGLETNYSIAIGLFEKANGSTLFLKNVDAMPENAQRSLLRILKEKTIKRTGSQNIIKTDTRLIVSSSVSLADAVSKNAFRNDLYHTLNEFSLDLALLREQRENIERFATYFLHQVNQKNNKNISGFEKDVVDLFKVYDWPGNFSELKDTVENAAIYTKSMAIKKEWLPGKIRNPDMLSNPSNSAESPKYQDPEDLRNAAMEAEKKRIIAVLYKVGHNKSEAARVLKIDRKTLYNKIKKYNIFN